MKLFVLFKHVYDESGSSVNGIYSTVENAKTAAQKQHFEYYSRLNSLADAEKELIWQEYTSDDGDHWYECGNSTGDELTITEWNLDDIP